jgi:hypothetical protein
MEPAMMPRPIALALGAAAGGLLAAVSLSTAVANADEFVYTPDPLNFLPEPGTEWGSSLGGFTGVGDWNTNDITTHTQVLDTLSGQGPELDYSYGIFGISLLNFSNDLFTVSSNISDPGGLAPGSVIDLTNLDIGETSSGVFANEFIDAAAGSTTPGLTDILLTPTGDFLLF